MIVSINQPAYLPWLGYFHRIAVSDLHVVLDHVQFEKNSFTNRNRLRTASATPWLTVPVRTKGRFGDLAINELEIAEDRWATKHLATIRQGYAKAPFFGNHEAALEVRYSQRRARLIEVIDDLTEYQLGAFGITTPLVRSSELEARGSKEELVVNICREVGATTYLSGPLGRDYLVADAFADAGIDLRFHDYVHPEYRQVHGGFEPYLAALDLLLNCGPDSLAVICDRQEAIA